MTKTRASRGSKLATVALATLLAACGARSESRPSTAISPQRGEDLWSFAPRQAAVGIVLADGAGAAWLDAEERWLAIARQEPMGKAFVDRFGGWLGGEHAFSAESFARDGMDREWGAAMFLDGELEPLLAVLPVVDQAAWRRAIGARVEGDVDVLPGARVGRCAIVRARYVCSWVGSPGQLVEEAAGASPLATSRRTLPTSLHGELDVHAIPVGGVADFLRQLAPVVGDVRLAALTLRLRPDGLAADALIEGKPSPVALAWAGEPAPTVDPASIVGAAGVTRVHFDPGTLRALLGKSWPYLEDIGVGADLLGQLDGKLVMITRGPGQLAGTARLGLVDPEPVRRLLASGCKAIAARGWLDPVALTWSGSTCTATHPAMSQASVSFAVQGKELVASWAFEARKDGPDAVAMAGSAESLASIRDPATVAIWARGFDFAHAMPQAWRERPSPMVRQARPVIEVASWLGVHVYDAGLTASIDEHGLRMAARVTTFTGDPLEARAAYARALERRQQRDWAGWMASLAEIEQQHPGTTAAKQAQLTREGYSCLGMNLGLVVGLVTVYNLLSAPHPR